MDKGINSTASLYVSTGNLAQSSSKQHSEPLTRQESEAQKKNVKIVEQLLKDFDLEETEEKYRNQNVIEIKFDPHAMRYDSATPKVRQRLRKLMGTDVIRLNDKRYMDKLSVKLKEEYEMSLAKKEKQLEEAEVERLRKLMLEGVIPMETNKKKKKGKKYPHHSKGGTHKSQHENSTEVITQVQVIEHSKSKDQNKILQVDHDVFQSDTETDITRIKSTDEQYKEGTKYTQKNRDMVESHSEKKGEPKGTTTPTSRPGTPKPGKYSKIESDLMRQLREAKTVDDLYDIADQVVYID